MQIYNHSTSTAPFRYRPTGEDFVGGWLAGSITACWDTGMDRYNGGHDCYEVTRAIAYSRTPASQSRDGNTNFPANI